MELKPEDKVQLDELKELRKNLYLEIQGRKLSNTPDYRRKFKDCTLDELVEWERWAWDKMETILAPYDAMR